MSYILDALKKSEQERGNGHIPSVQTMHTSSLNYNHKKSYWPYILITAVLLNLTAIVYFYLSKDESAVVNADSEQVANRNTQQQIPAPTPTPTPVQASIIKPHVDEISQQAEAKPIPLSLRHVPQDATTGTRDSVVHQTASAPVATSTADTFQEEPVFDNNSAQTATSDIIDYYDLPDSLRRQIPTITVSAHVYSDNPLQRSIVVNNNFLEEGERVLDDLVLIEITPEGAIMDYQGTVFNYEIVSGWQ